MPIRIGWYLCVHGEDPLACRVCEDWIRRFEQAKQDGDTGMLERLNEEAKDWHGKARNERSESQ